MFRIPQQSLKLKDCTIVHQMLYQTPVFEISIDGIDNRKLEEGIYKLKESDKNGVQLSNSGGWHSEIQYDNNVSDIFHPLTDKFRSILLNLPFTPSISKVVGLGIWANVNERYSYNKSHTHPQSDISGVYYVKVPEGDCGRLVVQDPRQAYSYGSRFFVERYSGGSTEIDPIEGKMYLFPSSLEHFVLSNNVDEDRISISFNLIVH